MFPSGWLRGETVPGFPGLSGLASRVVVARRFFLGGALRYGLFSGRFCRFGMGNGLVFGSGSPLENGRVPEEIRPDEEAEAWIREQG